MAPPIDALPDIDEATMAQLFSIGAASVPSALPTPVLQSWRREVAGLAASGAHPRVAGVRYQGMFLAGSIRAAMPITHAVLAACQRSVLDHGLAMQEPSMLRQLFTHVLLQRYAPGAGLPAHFDGMFPHPPHEEPDDAARVAANRAYFGLSFIWTIEGAGQFTVHDRSCWDRPIDSTVTEPGSVTITLNAPIDPASDPALFAERFPVHSVTNICGDRTRTIMSFDMKVPHDGFGFDRIVREWFDEAGRTLQR
ncbi:MAG: hypothetical protein ACE367_10735 [Acidimicrobiales bacterium]